ncbi:hypothetical protein [Heyndrickxia oleronia]|nr:hypothetical protein [Heyndrickxia oleronia]
MVNRLGWEETMEQFTYQVPEKVHITTIIPILNEKKKLHSK